MSDRKLILYFGALCFIVIAPCISAFFTPKDVFEAAELVPARRYLADEMKKEADKKEPIDVLFLARSSMQNSIHPKLIEEKLALPGSSYRIYMAGLREGDLFGVYLILKEFFENRKIGVVILSDAFVGRSLGLVSGLMFNSPEFSEDWKSYDLLSKIALWRVAALASLINIRNSIFPMEFKIKRAGLETRYYYRKTQGKFPKEARVQNKEPPNFTFKKLNEKRKKLFADSVVSSFDESIPTTFIDVQINQLLIQRMIELCRKNGAKFYFHHSPSLKNPDGRTKFIFPPGKFEYLNQDIAGTVSLPWSLVFPELSEREVSWYFGDEGHLNEDGSHYYSRSIVPAVERILLLREK